MPLDDANPFADLVPKQPASLAADNPFADLVPHVSAQQPPTTAPPAPTPAAPEDTGLIAAVTAGLLRPVREFGQTAQTLGGEQPTAAPPPRTVAEQPVELSDLAHPYRLGEKILYQTAAGAPALAAGIGAGAAAAPAGPFAALGAGAIAYGATSAVQQLGPIFAEELGKNAKDPEGAWNRTLAKAAETGAFGSLGWAAFGVKPFESTVRNLLFQAFVMQPGMGVAERATQNVQEGKPASEGLTDAYAQGVAGTAIPILGVEGAKFVGRRLAGRTEAQAEGAAPETARPSAATAPPPQMPAVGSKIGVMQGDEGVRPMDVTGYSPDGQYVSLAHEDGTPDMMLVKDLPSRMAPLPEQAPEPAPEREQSVSVDGTQVQEATTVAPTPEGPPAAPAPATTVIDPGLVAEQQKLPQGYQIIAPDPVNDRFSLVSPEGTVVAEALEPEGLATQAEIHAASLVEPTPTATIEPEAETADNQARAKLLQQAESAPEETAPNIDELGDRVDDLFQEPVETPQVAAPAVEDIRADQEEIAQQAAEAVAPEPPPALTDLQVRTLQGMSTDQLRGVTELEVRPDDTVGELIRKAALEELGRREAVAAAAPPAPLGPEGEMQAAGPAREALIRGLADAPRGWESVSNVLGDPRKPSIDLTADLQAHHRDLGSADPHTSTRDWVLDRGKSTGFEHYGAIGAEGQITDGGTTGHQNEIYFSDATRRRVWAPGAVPEAFHHNHPSEFSLSVPDVMMLAAPGISSVSAHTHEGAISSASLTPEAQAMLAGLSPREAQDRIKLAAGVAEGIAAEGVSPLVKRGMLPEQRGNILISEARNRLLAANGLIDYVSTRDLPPWLNAHLERYAQSLGPEGEAFRDRLHRSAGVLRPEEAMGRISGTHAEIATGRTAGAGGPRIGEAGTGEPGGGADTALASGRLAEEPDITERAAEEATEQAGGDDASFHDLARKQGSLPESPGGKWHEFNAINKDWTTFTAKGRMDPLAAPKVNAELQRHEDAKSFLNSYKTGLASWQGKSPELWRKIFSAMELLTLEGRKVPLDGRAVVAQNLDRPLAALSKPGEIITLQTPEELRMFTEYARTMDKVWGDVVEQTARRFGWEGTPTSEAMLEAASKMAGAAAHQVQRAAKIVAAVEWQRRESYLPLMRSGDYFARVTPKAGTPDKPGIRGWDGDGFSPTVMFRMFESRTPMERFLGGMREGTPRTAQAELEKLREQFPPSEYDISHGFLNKPEETIRGLDIPVIEKLMMLVGNDIRGTMRERLAGTGMSADDARKAAQTDYDKLVDDVLDQIVQSRVIGPRRERAGVAGYDPDFSRSTGKYLNWLSSHVANIKNGAEIDRGNAIIESHPDPRTKAYFRDWDRRQEDYGDQIAGPLMKMRQGAFYWFLGANAASTLKIFLHGPLLGAPVLSTGLGGPGRARAVADYLNAVRQLAGGLGVGARGAEVDITRGARTPEEQALIAEAEGSGLLHSHGADELAAVQRGGEEALSPQQRFNRRVLDIWGSNISVADRLIRGAMLLSAHRIATREGMDTINRVWDRDELWRAQPEKTPEAFARFMVNRSVGLWGDINRMPVLRSQLGGMIGQFRNYEILWLSNLYNMATRMGPEGKVTATLMLGGLGLLGGAVAMPFIQDAEKAAEFVWGMITGIAPDFQNDLKRAMDAHLPGSDMGEGILHGFRPFGVDYGTIGFGDLISRMGQSPLDYAGAAVSAAVGGPYRAWERYHSSEDVGAAVRELMPTAVKNLIGGLYPETATTSAATGYVTMPPSQLSEADRVKMALGFRPAATAIHSEQTQAFLHARTAFDAALKHAEDRIANLMVRGQSTAAAMADADRLIEQNQWALRPNEAATLKRDVRFRAAQRLHPEILSRQQAAFQAAQQPPR